MTYTSHLNHCSISPRYFSGCGTPQSVVGGEFDGTLADEVKEVKIFRVGRVGDGNANCAKTTGRQRSPDF